MCVCVCTGANNDSVPIMQSTLVAERNLRNFHFSLEFFEFIWNCNARIPIRKRREYYGRDQGKSIHSEDHCCYSALDSLGEIPGMYEVQVQV